MAARRTFLQLEQLGARDLPSATALLAVPVPTTEILAVAHSSVQTPTGVGHGNYVVNLVQSGMGKTYQLKGTVKLDGIGVFTVKGSIHTVGYVNQGEASGLLTFANSRGSFTLQVVGPEQAAFAVLPAQFSYQILAGTKAYQSLQQTGTLNLKVGRLRAGSFTFTMQATPEAAMVSGIRGLVVVGPAMPISMAGMSNTRVLPGAVISIQPAGGGEEIAEVTSDGAGLFHLALPAGDYMVVPLSTANQLLPHGAPQSIHLAAGQILDLSIMFDSGIR